MMTVLRKAIFVPFYSPQLRIPNVSREIIVGCLQNVVNREDKSTFKIDSPDRGFGPGSSATLTTGLIISETFPYWAYLPIHIYKLTLAQVLTPTVIYELELHS